MTNPYFGKAVDVDRVLLVRYPQTMNLRNLAKESKVSLGEASKVSNALIEEGLATRDSRRSEFKLMSPSDLLKRWAAVNNFVRHTKFIEYYSSEEDISKFLEKLKGLDTPEYAVTGLAGALFVAPMVRPTNVHIYVKSEEDAQIFAHLLNLTPVEANGNVKFAIPKSLGVFYGSKEIDGIKIACDVQLYVDLFNYPARGEEAATSIFTRLQNTWINLAMKSLDR
ncbi:MAG: type IV toxin-antitoxin system AbiEi family antitoxin [Halobacteriota archaeon]